MTEYEIMLLYSAVAPGIESIIDDRMRTGVICIALSNKILLSSPSENEKNLAHVYRTLSVTYHNNNND